MNHISLLIIVLIAVFTVPAHCVVKYYYRDNDFACAVPYRIDVFPEDTCLGGIVFSRHTCSGQVYTRTTYQTSQDCADKNGGTGILENANRGCVIDTSMGTGQKIWKTLCGKPDLATLPARSTYQVFYNTQTCNDVNTEYAYTVFPPVCYTYSSIANSHQSANCASNTAASYNSVSGCNANCTICSNNVTIAANVCGFYSKFGCSVPSTPTPIPGDSPASPQQSGAKKPNNAVAFIQSQHMLVLIVMVIVSIIVANVN